MPGSSTSVFGDLDDFAAALRAEGVVRVMTTRRGQFRARLTRVALHRLTLTSGEEELPRIAFVAVPANMLVVAVAIGGEGSPVWGGIEAQASEIVTAGPGERVHALTTRSGQWGAIRIPQQTLLEYGRVLTGASLDVPIGVARWRPAPAPGRHFFGLYRAAIRTAQSPSKIFADVDAAHGLEQQLLHAFIECLSAGPSYEETPAARRHREVLARFEDLLEAGSRGRMTDIRAALGVSQRLLRGCCEAHLAMSPSHYRRRRAMENVHRALRSGDPQTTTVSEVAGKHGFRDLGRFAGSYRAIFGELPSATLQLRSARGLADRQRAGRA
jgi:AraC-like DNA-binding protein